MSCVRMMPVACGIALGTRKETAPPRKGPIACHCPAHLNYQLYLFVQCIEEGHREPVIISIELLQVVL